MPYDPYAPTEKQRSRMIVMMLVAAAAMLMLHALYFLRPGHPAPGPIAGFAIGGLLSAALQFRADDYFRALCAMGQRFAMAGLATYALVAWAFPTTLHASGPVWRALHDGYYIALCLGTAFYAGYAWAWLRTR